MTKKIILFFTIGSFIGSGCIFQKNNAQKNSIENINIQENNKMTIKNSTFTTVNNPEINALTSEFLAIESKLGTTNEQHYINHFAIFTSDNPLSLKDVDEITFVEMVNYFKTAGIYSDSEAENAIGFKSDNVKKFNQYDDNHIKSSCNHKKRVDLDAPINPIELIRHTLEMYSFGFNAFSEFDYRQPNTAEAKQYFESYREFVYEAIDIDKRNQLIQQLAGKVIELAPSGQFAYHYLCSAMDDPSNAVEHIHFWISGNTLIAFTEHRYL